MKYQGFYHTLKTNCPCCKIHVTTPGVSKKAFRRSVKRKEKQQEKAMIERQIKDA